MDAKTRKELLKYLITKKHGKKNGAVNEAEVSKKTRIICKKIIIASG